MRPLLDAPAVAIQARLDASLQKYERLEALARTAVCDLYNQDPDLAWNSELTELARAVGCNDEYLEALDRSDYNPWADEPSAVLTVLPAKESQTISGIGECYL